MKTNKIILVLSSMFLLAACGNHATQESSSEETTTRSSPLETSLESLSSDSGESSQESTEETSEERGEESESQDISTALPEESTSGESTVDPEESTSSTVYAFQISTSISGFRIVFDNESLDQNAVPAETEVTFHLEALADYYTLTAVYLSVTGDLSKTTLTADKEGKYSFFMPYADITLSVASTRKYELRENFSHASVQYLSEVKTYYSFGDRISFKVSVEEGYNLTEVYYTYGESGKSKLKADDSGIYSFSMPEAIATLVIETQEAISNDSDPWAGAPATYQGLISSPTDYDNHSTMTVVFHGNGLLSYHVDWEQWDEWEYDWYLAENYACDNNVPYSYDEATDSFTANVHVRSQSIAPTAMHFKANKSGDQVSSITIQNSISNDSNIPTANKTLTKIA